MLSDSTPHTLALVCKDFAGWGCLYDSDEMLAHGSDQRLSRTAVEGGVVESPRSRRRSALRERQTLSWKQPWAARFARIL